MSETPAEPLYLPLPLRGPKALKASWKPILASWLVPGLGYWMIGEKRRAKIQWAVTGVFVLMAILQLQAGAGEGARGGVYTPQLSPLQWLPTLGALATLGVGPVYVPFALMFGGAAAEPVRNLTQEYGATYLMVSGLLNWLCCFDLFDRVTNRWWWRLDPDEQEEISVRNKPAAGE